MYLFKNGTVITQTLIEQGAVAVVEDRIVYVGPQGELPSEIDGIDSEPFKVIDCKGQYIAPGLIDVHIHGANGGDIMDGSEKTLQAVAEFCASHGVTGFLPSTVTASREDTANVAKLVSTYQGGGAKVLGIHLEGPYVNTVRKGAQYGPEIRRPDVDELADLWEILGSKLKLVTLAPEIDGSEQAIKYLTEKGVTVSIGHSDATYQQTLDGFMQGISHVTHTYNGMRGLHHRDPGVVGAALNSPQVFCELIADGNHVHPGAMQVLYQAKGPDKIVLITDALQAAGLADGEYVLGDQCVKVENQVARLTSGALAGSVIGLNQAVKNVVGFLGIPLTQAVQMASINPARSLNLTNKGRLAKGFAADVIVLNTELDVELTMVEGRICYQREKEVEQ